MIAIGDVVADRYVVERLLGTGGLADVYLVRHNSLGSHHALKILTWDRPSVDRRLLLEGQIQAQLRHPNVVAVTDVMRVNGRAALLLDYVDGPTLDVYLASEPADLDALDIFSGIIAAVVRAHDAGVLHRDLKPQNILLERLGDRYISKVTDFGLAKVLQEELATSKTRAEVTMGTPGYMAPEQVRDAASVDTRTDIFALGALLHELLGGRPAFADDDGHISLTATIERQAPPLPETVPAHLRELVAEALSVDPNDRPPTVREFAERAFLPDDPRRRDVLALGGTPIAFGTRREALPEWSSIDHSKTAPPTTNRPTVIPDGSSAEQPSRSPLLAIFLAMMVVGAVGAWLASRALTPSEPVAAAVPQPAPTEAPAAPVDAGPPTDELPNDVQGETPAAPERTPTPNDASNDGVTAAASSNKPTSEEPAPVPEPQPAPASVDPAPASAPAAPAPAAPADAAPAPAVPAPAAPAPEPEPVVAAAPDLKTQAAAMTQRLVGTWSGTAQGRPFSLRIDSASPSQVRGALIFTGPSQRITDMTGSANGDSIELTDTTGSVTLKAQIDGSTLNGAYRKGRRDVPFTAKR